jgi:hypothetical protein
VPIPRPPASDPPLTAAIRRFTFWILAFAIAGMATELVFIGHVEDVAQWVPLAVLGAGGLALAWHGAAPQGITVRVVQAVMALFVASGIAGVALHYRGNVEFEREMYPTLAGFQLVRQTLTGATPVLAPGSMTLLGLVGLTLTYKHPLVTRPGEQ